MCASGVKKEGIDLSPLPPRPPPHFACLALREPVELSGDSAEECCQRAFGSGVKWITLCMHEYITSAAVCFPWQGSGMHLGPAPCCLPGSCALIVAAEQ